MARKLSENQPFLSRVFERIEAKYIDIFRMFSDCDPIDSDINGYGFYFFLKTEMNEPFCLSEGCPSIGDEGLESKGSWTIHAETEEAAKRAKSEIEEALVKNKSFSREDVIRIAEEYARMVINQNVDDERRADLNAKWFEKNL